MTLWRMALIVPEPLGPEWRDWPHLPDLSWANELTEPGRRKDCGRMRALSGAPGQCQVQPQSGGLKGI